MILKGQNVITITTCNTNLLAYKTRKVYSSRKYTTRWL